MTALPQGIHQLYIRSKDANGNWSVTNRSFFYKTGNSNSASNANIVKLEYFFDADPGFGNGIDVPVTPGNNIANLNIVPDISAVGLGAHLLSVRSKDEKGSWSITNSVGFLRDSLKVFLQGFYTGSGNLTPALLNQGESMDATIVDSITLRLHAQYYPYPVVITTKAILNTDGTLSVFFTDIDPTQNYWLSIQHRNHIETWSSSPINFNSNPSYDFTSSASQAYGSNQAEVESGIYALYAGDINQDGVIDGLDYNNWETDNNNFGAGYLATDLNGDGIVDGLDFCSGKQITMLLLEQSFRKPS
ncbi:MAG: hypothetical protein HWD58_10620 [Bacteroidota bacterium]|nr:MAG: hypothetical protein HWD58_10620 [Bacteroidota bacterium]